MKDYSDLHNYGVFEGQLPQIPQSFIEEYCEKGGIGEVELEYEFFHDSEAFKKL